MVRWQGPTEQESLNRDLQGTLHRAGCLWLTVVAFLALMLSGVTVGHVVRLLRPLLP